MHLCVLGRLSRLKLRARFLDELRATETVQKMLQLIERSERELRA
jgi:mannitol/fructose-specific phosphotransferase system IIA component (Ntr-type)